ncbi:MAG: Gfo/Idh/MocA family oxidoreductase [Planctomycetota bacterium]|nr:Gfo/Idh/MocA family oxidoreductase [Planctomycetota bacterium]
MREIRIGCLGPQAFATAVEAACAGLAGVRVVEAAQTDAVYLAVPLAGRAQAALACLNEGRHVLAEAPLCLDWSDFDACMAAAQEKDLRLAAALPYRFWPAAMLARDQVQAAPLGFPKEANIEGFGAGLGPWGTLLPCEGPLASAVHLLDLVRWTLATEPQSFTPQPGGFRVELGHIASGVQVAEARADGLEGSRLTFKGDAAPIVFDAPSGVEVKDLLRPMLAEFAAAIREGREPEVNAADALSAVGASRGAGRAAQDGARFETIRHHFEHDLDAAWERAHRSPRPA